MHGTQNQAATSQFHEALRHPKTCIQFGEILGAQRQRAPICASQKTKQMQDIKSVRVCVCVSDVYKR